MFRALLIAVALSCVTAQHDDVEMMIGSEEMMDMGEDHPDLEGESLPPPPKLSSRTRKPFWRKGGKKEIDWEVLFDDWVVEAVAAAFVALFIVNYFLGTSENESKARGVVSALVPFLKEEFESVGFPSGEVMKKDADHCFEVFASGRRSVHGFHLYIELQCRQDALYRFVLKHAQPTLDRIRVEIPLDALEPFCFALCRRGARGKAEDKNWEIKELGKPRKNCGLPESFLCISDNSEVSEAALVKSEFNLLDKKDLFVLQSLLLLPSSPSSPPLLEVELLFPPSPSCLVPLVRAVMRMVDVVTGIRFTEKARFDALQKRKNFERKIEKVESEEERRERLEKKKIEKKREEEEKISKMNPEKQRKMEKKEARKEMRQRAGQRMKMVK